VSNINKKAMIASVAIGICASLALFLTSWITDSFESLLIPQLPGFLVGSWLWGFPGFSQHPSSQVRGAFLFPYVMIIVNSFFYGTLARILFVVVSRSRRQQSPSR